MKELQVMLNRKKFEEEANSRYQDSEVSRAFQEAEATRCYKNSSASDTWPDGGCAEEYETPEEVRQRIKKEQKGNNSVNEQTQEQQSIQTAGQVAQELEQRFQVVDLEELNRVETRLVQLKAKELSAYKKTDIFFTNRKGQLDFRTAGAFLQKGLPFLEKGLNSILKDRDHASRLRCLLRLEAVYEICRKGVRWEHVSHQQIDETQACIQHLKMSYQPHAIY